MRDLKTVKQKELLLTLSLLRAPLSRQHLNSLKQKDSLYVSDIDLGETWNMKLYTRQKAIKIIAKRLEIKSKRDPKFAIVVNKEIERVLNSVLLGDVTSADTFKYN